MARKRVIQGEAESQLLDALRAGAFVREAAEHAGVGERTVYDEMKRNPQFSQAVTRARADARVEAIATIRRAMPEDWKAAAFYLERTDPANWGRRTAHEHSGPAGGAIPAEVTTGAIDPRRLSREQRAALREMLDAQADCVEG